MLIVLKDMKLSENLKVRYFSNLNCQNLKIKNKKKIKCLQKKKINSIGQLQSVIFPTIKSTPSLSKPMNRHVAILGQAPAEKLGGGGNLIIIFIYIHIRICN